MVQDWYRIDDVGAAGQGLVAEFHISRGSVIPEEKPLLVLDTGVRKSQWRKGTTFFQKERSRGSAIIHPEIEASRRNTTIRALHHNITGDQRQNDINIVEINAWSFEKDNNHWLSIFDTMSRINHSCVPNTRVSHPCLQIRSLGTMKLIATKNIAPNEEITVEYVQDDVWLKPRDTRQTVLQRDWDFWCACFACKNRNAIHKKAELADLTSLKRAVSMPLPRQVEFLDDFPYRIRRVEYYATWLKDYGYGDSRLTEAYHRLAQLYMKADRYAEAHQAIIAGLEIESHEYETTIHVPRLQKLLSQCVANI